MLMVGIFLLGSFFGGIVGFVTAAFMVIAQEDEDNDMQ